MCPCYGFLSVLPSVSRKVCPRRRAVSLRQLSFFFIIVYCCSVICAVAGTKNTTAPQPPVSVSSSSSNAHQQRFESTANATSLSPSLSPTAAVPASFTRRASDQSKAVNSDGQISLSDVQPPEGLGAVMVEHVRRNTGLSHEKSQLAVATVLNLLAERVPATENLVSAIQEDVTHQHVCACLLICTLEIFSILTYLVP